MKKTVWYYLGSILDLFLLILPFPVFCMAIIVLPVVVTAFGGSVREAEISEIVLLILYLVAFLRALSKWEDCNKNRCRCLTCGDSF